MPYFLKVHYEVLERRDDTLAVDIGAIDDPNLVTRERVCLLDVLRSARVVVSTLMDAVWHAEVGP